MDIAKIEIQMTGVTPKDVERYRKYIEKIVIEIIKFERGFELKNGKIICNFDNDKNMREMEFNFKRRTLDKNLL
jgi:hypothetical protein